MIEDTTRKLPAYSQRLSLEKSAEIFAKVVEKMTKEKYYRQPGGTATALAKELGVDIRYISAAAIRHNYSGYSELVNSYRLKEACRMLASPVHARFTAEEVGLMVGYSSRQAFYKAFKKVHGCTPLDYRNNNLINS